MQEGGAGALTSTTPLWALPVTSADRKPSIRRYGARNASPPSAEDASGLGMVRTSMSSLNMDTGFVPNAEEDVGLPAETGAFFSSSLFA